MEQTLKAMKRISEIQSKRQQMFFNMRMRAHKATQREVIKAEIKKGMDILVPAVVTDKEKVLAKVQQKALAKRKVTEEKMEN